MVLSSNIAKQIISGLTLRYADVRLYHVCGFTDNGGKETGCLDTHCSGTQVVYGKAFISIL